MATPTEYTTPGLYEPKSCFEKTVTTVLGAVAALAGLVAIVALAALFIPTVAFLVSVSLFTVHVTLAISAALCLITALGALFLGCRSSNPVVETRRQEAPQVPLSKQFEKPKVIISSCYIGPHIYFHVKPESYLGCENPEVFESIKKEVADKRPALIVTLGAFQWPLTDAKHMPLSGKLDAEGRRAVLQTAYETAQAFKKGPVLLASGSERLQTNVVFMVLVEACSQLEEIKALPNPQMTERFDLILTRIEDATHVNVGMDRRNVWNGWCEEIRIFNPS